MDAIQSRLSRAERPVRVLQYGEGNFLRGFVDYMLDIANERGVFDGNIVLVKPIPFGNLEPFHAQDCLYTVSLRGLVEGKPTEITRAVTSVQDAVDCHAEYQKYMDFAKLPSLRFVVSNTTEAGIVYDEADQFELRPPNSFPGKLTQFLYARCTHFGYAPDKGLIMLPVELIDDNGVMLKRCVKQLSERWGLGQRFIDWLDEACVFTSTLVDRIITGYPKDEDRRMWDALGYEDRLLVTGEPFALWVIESERDISKELPLPEAGLPVVFTDNQKPYKQRKVRILNGAHTSFVLASYLCGHDDVLSSMQDPLIRTFMERTLFDEVIPTLDLPRADLVSFADEVSGRFANPYVKHLLLSIALNSVAKWRARCMPSLLEYVKRTGELPARLTFSLAALMRFYQGGALQGGALTGERDGERYKIVDDLPVLEFFEAHGADEPVALAERFLGNEAFFGPDLVRVPGIVDAVAGYLADIRGLGMRGAMEKAFA